LRKIKCDYTNETEESAAPVRILWTFYELFINFSWKVHTILTGADLYQSTYLGAVLYGSTLFAEMCDY